jgi:hypothetical protein
MLWTFPIILALAGCSSTKESRERGWIGGEYRLAARPQVFGSDGVPSFPPGLPEHRGLLLTALYADSPVAEAGLVPGDLLLEVDGDRVTSARRFHQRIQSSQPSTRLPVTFYRDGEIRRTEIVLGRETYETWHNVGVGLFFSGGVDLWPNPDFSLIALGYGTQSGSPELSSPESRYIRHCAADGGEGASAPPVKVERWHVWLPVLRFGETLHIKSQEKLEVQRSGAIGSRFESAGK